MQPDLDSSHYYIEDTSLLKFLITRYTEMLQQQEPNLDPVWSGLGLVALHQNKELENAFKALMSSDSYTAEEVVTSSVDLFLAELARLETAEVTDHVGKRVLRPPLSRWTARKFLIWTWREGRKMKQEQDFEFYAVWELIAWLALSSDEYIKEFDQRCRFSESSTEEKIRAGLAVIKSAIFKRPMDDAVYQPDMPTGTRQNDWETNQ
jgi:hypothetical protein